MAIIVLVYGILVLVGGVMGWVKAKSKPSLISGIAFGVALIVLGYGINQRHASDVWVAIGLAGLLAVIMGIRFAKTKMFLPAGLLTIVSAAVAAALLLLR